MREESEAIEEANKLKQAGTKVIAVGKNFSAIVSHSAMKKWPHKCGGLSWSRQFNSILLSRYIYNQAW